MIDVHLSELYPLVCKMMKVLRRKVGSAMSGTQSYHSDMMY